MKDDLSIGLLLPASSIVPMGKDFERGLKSVLKDIQDVDIEISSEYVANGDMKLIEDACSKFINFDHVDIVTGILNNRVTHEIAAKFEGKNSLLLANSLGETWPSLSHLNDRIFLNSTQVWKQVWSLANYATRTFGKKGMFVASTFDSGFSFSAILDQAMLANGEDTSWSFSIAPVPEAQSGGLAEVEKVIPHIIANKPDFVFAAFCGEEASIFLEQFVEHDLHKNTKLICLPYLIEEVKTKLKEPLTLYTARAANEGTAWVDPFTWRKDFKLLGIETGMAIAEALSHGDGLRAALAAIYVDSERGKVSFHPQKEDELSICLSEIVFQGEIATAEVVSCTPIETIGVKNEDIQRLASERSAGWFNPYLAV